MTYHLDGVTFRSRAPCLTTVSLLVSHNAWNLVELTPSNGVLMPGRRIPLPPGRWDPLVYAHVGTDDDGRLVLVGPSVIIRIDLRSGVIVNQAVTGIIIWRFAMPRAGRLAVAAGLDGVGNWIVVSLDANGTVSRVWYRRPVLSPGGGTHQQVYTTHTGRTFLGLTPDPTILASHSSLSEIDYQSGRLNNHLPIGGSEWVFRLIEDPNRELLYLDGSFTGGHNFAAFDLTANRIRFRFSAVIPFLSQLTAWMPQDRLAVSPHAPQVGSTFEARWSMGGDPGDPALIWFNHALISGQPITGIGFVMGVGAADASGLLKLQTTMTPTGFPMNAGDAFVFEGFRLRGTELRRTGLVEMQWQ